MVGKDLPYTDLIPTAEDFLKLPRAVKKALADETYDWDIDNVKSLQFWVKQILAIVVGIILALGKVGGVSGFLMALSVTFVATTMLKQRLRITDDVMTTSELFNEGLPQSLQLFLLVWICAHTLLHQDI
eukprot:Blabericola_migrator_1__10285@NODE_576_length_7504_cov_229_698131_g428_i0_p4_GENE_NODE_576_length_7504_cov_229_698131_g428_i0NODE_576_length_7504_cov_229_698131_g428_i0_p4_ORF_typecomplete_len129_score33_47Rab5ip/PF07019_12/2_2e08_NODE_576_length_7504_cov_229_698131_g428_i0330716